MQGLWKNNIGGWNTKNTKRKKQTHKQLLKDKFRALVNADKRGETSSLRKEGDVEVILDKTVYKKSGWIEIWKIQISRYHGWTMEAISTRDAYIWNGAWYDNYSYEKIDLRGASVKKMIFLHKEEIEYSKPIAEYQPRHWSTGISTKSTTFVYGKPVRKKIKYWNDGKRRGFAQKNANSKDRQRLRAWIRKGDWNSEIKTHALSKSILWEVH